MAPRLSWPTTYMHTPQDFSSSGSYSSIELIGIFYFQDKTSRRSRPQSWETVLQNGSITPSLGQHGLKIWLEIMTFPLRRSRKSFTSLSQPERWDEVFSLSTECVLRPSSSEVAGGSPMSWCNCVMFYAKRRSETRKVWSRDGLAVKNNTDCTCNQSPNTSWRNIFQTMCWMHLSIIVYLNNAKPAFFGERVTLFRDLAI